MDEPELRALIGRVRRKLRVTKVVATRSIKLKNGEFFAGFSAAWDSVQPTNPQADLDLVMSDEEVAANGMTLQEARASYYMVAMETDIRAYEQAYANGALSEQALNDSVRAVKNNYAWLLRRAFLTPPPSDTDRNPDEGGSDED